MDDPMLELGMTAIGNFSKTTMPGKYLVDVIPARMRPFVCGLNFCLLT
jgi:hypothetical protein